MTRGLLTQIWLTGMLMLGALGIYAGAMGAQASPAPAPMMLRPATAGEHQRHQEQMLLERLQIAAQCGADRVTPVCDWLVDGGEQ